jgi:hypothetical protein
MSHQSRSDRAAFNLSMMRLLLLLALLDSILLSTPGEAGAQETPAGREFPQKVHYALKGISEKPAKWELFGVNPEKHVRFERQAYRQIARRREESNGHQFSLWMHLPSELESMGKDVSCPACGKAVTVPK